MRRLIVVLCLACLWVGSTIAAPVTRAVAETVARNVFLSQLHPIPATYAMVKASFPLKWSRWPVIWAVNFHEGGFVLLSADDRARPVLGICHDGAYDPKVHVPGLDWMLTEWSREIHHIIRNQLPATPEIEEEWKAWRSPRELLTAHASSPPLPLPIVVPPLLSTTWNQGCHYNANCPVDAGGSCGRVWTGCGATALAQAMKYHAWPITGFGTYSYTPFSYPLQSANYGATTYNWAAMPANVTAANPAVAQLMHHCGVALDMNYGTSESTCFFSGLSSAAKRYFRYSLSTTGRSKFLYTDAQWDTVLRTELDASRIVPYNGGPHIWLCDGYQTGPDLYHMNWGWGGTYNGYYAQNSLNPGSLTFSTVSCIVQMKPVGAFEVEGDSVAFGENAGNATVEVAGDSNWTATASAGWIGLSIGSGIAGYFQPIISVPANPSYSTRYGYVAFQRGAYRDTVWVRQAGITPRLSVTPNPILEGAAGGSRVVTVTCDSNWVVTFADSWIGYAPASGVGNGSVTLTIASNPGAGSRTGTVTFTRGSLTVAVTVNQDGTSAFWCAPVIASPAAVGATHVQVKTLSRASGISEGYILAPDSTILRVDSTYALHVSFSGSVAPAIWIDWNQDGDFFDAGEAIVPPSGSWYPTFGGMKTVNFTVPSTATLGQTRLRVYVKAFPGPAAGPCATTSVGDIEDFNVYVQPTLILPIEGFVLRLEGGEDVPGLHWTWESPLSPQRFRILFQEDMEWESVEEVDGHTHAWTPADALPAGRYQVEAQLANGNRSRSNVVEHAGHVSSAHVRLSPNPVVAGHSVLLQFPRLEPMVELRIIDVQGREVRRDQVMNASLCYLSTAGWEAGVYLVQVRIRGKAQCLRMVVQ